MNIIYFLMPLALLLGGSFAAAFALSSWRGQYDDLETPAHRMLLDDEIKVQEKGTPKSANVTEIGTKKGTTT